MKRLPERRLARVLLCLSLNVSACGYTGDEPMPEVKRRPELAECGLPAPAALQVAGDDIETCIPDSPGEFYAEISLTISAEGNVTASRIGDSTTGSVAACIRKLLPTMEFLVVDPCHKGSVDIDLAFGRSGVS